MVDIPRRKLLVPALAVAGASLLPKRADADIAFANFAFPATGAPRARTMPDRLAEVKNVLDFGADPTGSNASATTAAIQAAVNWTSGANRGTIYFPFGFYTINAPITFDYNGDLSIRFVADLGTAVVGNFAGYLFDRHNVKSGSPNNTQGLRTFENFNFQNPSTNAAAGCVRMGSTNGGAFIDCSFLGQTCVTTEDSAGNSSQNISFENCLFAGPSSAPYTANGIIIGGTGVITGCDFHDIGTAVRAYGSGLHICGSRSEHTNNGFMFGLDSADVDQGASGFSLTSFSTEGNGTAVYLAGTCSGFLIGPGGSQGHDSSNSGYPTGVQASQYGLRLGANCSAGLILDYSVGSVADVASISIANASARANVFFLSCNAIQTGGMGVSWQLPTNAFTAFFQYCNQQPVWTFSQLPTGGNVLEGDEFSLSDANTTTWGASVTSGGGSSRIGVRYNGTNFTVFAK